LSFFNPRKFGDFFFYAEIFLCVDGYSY